MQFTLATLCICVRRSGSVSRCLGVCLVLRAGVLGHRRKLKWAGPSYVVSAAGEHDQKQVRFLTEDMALT